MVWLTARQGNVVGMMIDGYLPEFEHIASVDWKQLGQQGRVVRYASRILPKYLSDYRLHSIVPDERLQLKIYGQLINDIRIGFCERINNTRRTSYQPLTAGANWYSLENHLQATEKRQDSTAPLIREYEADRQKKRGPYLQNLIIGSTIPQNQCKVMWECCENWMRILDFRIKPGEDYVDIQEFTTAWGKRLKNELSEREGRFQK